MSPSLKAKSEAGAEAKPEAIPISEERHRASPNTNFFITALVDVCLLMQIPEKGKQLFPVSFGRSLSLSIVSRSVPEPVEGQTVSSFRA